MNRIALALGIAFRHADGLGRRGVGGGEDLDAVGVGLALGFRFAPGHDQAL